MSMISTPGFSQIYFGNESDVAPYPLPYLVYDAEDVQVIITKSDGSVFQLDPSEFEVTGVGNPEGVSVTTASPIDRFDLVEIRRIVSYVQTLDLTSGRIDAEGIERALDLQTMMHAQSAAAAGGPGSRALQYSALEPSSTNTVLETPAGRSNRLLGFGQFGELAYYTLNQVASLVAGTFLRAGNLLSEIGSQGIEAQAQAQANLGIQVTTTNRNGLVPKPGPSTPTHYVLNAAMEWVPPPASAADLNIPRLPAYPEGFSEETMDSSRPPFPFFIPISENEPVEDEAFISDAISRAEVSYQWGIQGRLFTICTYQDGVADVDQVCPLNGVDAPHGSNWNFFGRNNYYSSGSDRTYIRHIKQDGLPIGLPIAGSPQLKLAWWNDPLKAINDVDDRYKISQVMVPGYEISGNPSYEIVQSPYPTDSLNADGYPFGLQKQPNDWETTLGKPYCVYSYTTKDLILLTRVKVIEKTGPAHAASVGTNFRNRTIYVPGYGEFTGNVLGSTTLSTEVVTDPATGLAVTHYENFYILERWVGRVILGIDPDYAGLFVQRY